MNGGFLMGYWCWLTLLCPGFAVLNWSQDAVSFAAICRDSAMWKWIPALLSLLQIVGNDICRTVVGQYKM